MENEDNRLILTDDQGIEHAYEILFTYENEERQAHYVLYFDPAAPDDIFAARIEGEELTIIEDDAEYAEVEEVLNAFLEDPQLQENEEDDE